MYQGCIPKKMNAKSHLARQLASIVFLAPKPEVRQLRVNCASGRHGRQFQCVEERKEDRTRPSPMSQPLTFGADGVFGAKTGNAICASFRVILE